MGLVELGAFIGGALAMGFGAMGAGIGEGYTAGHACNALSRQPNNSGNIVKTMLIGQAVIETAAIFALLIAILLIFVVDKTASKNSITMMISYLSAGIAIGLGAIGPGIGCGFPAGKACESSARNPKQSNDVIITMLIGQAVAQTPMVFALVVSLLLSFMASSLFVATDTIGQYFDAACALGAALSVGISSVGTGWGSGSPAGGACEVAGRFPESLTRVRINMLLGQAVAQTTAIFALVVALVSLFAINRAGLTDIAASISKMGAILGAGICMGFGAIGAAIGSGIAAEQACIEMGKDLENYSLLTRTMLLGQAVAQSTSIYAMVIAFILIFVAA